MCVQFDIFLSCDIFMFAHEHTKVEPVLGRSCINSAYLPWQRMSAIAICLAGTPRNPSPPGHGTCDSRKISSHSDACKKFEGLPVRASQGDLYLASRSDQKEERDREPRNSQEWAVLRRQVQSLQEGLQDPRRPLSQWQQRGAHTMPALILLHSED